MEAGLTTFSVDPKNNCFPLQNIDPNLQCKIQQGLLRYLEAAIYRIPLDAALAKQYLHKLGQADSTMCEDRATTESVEHLFCHYIRYTHQRNVLTKVHKFQRSENLDLYDVLGTWTSGSATHRPMKPLIHFLKSAESYDHL